jgi:flagellin-like hook-associated protein FlgL
MSVAGIESVITPKFLSALARSAGGSARSRSGQSEKDQVSTALQTGLRTYVAAVQGLNTAASFVNLAQSDLGRLAKIVDEMKGLATAASKAGTGSQARSEADNRIQRLGKEFEKFVATSQFQGQNYLSKDGLSGLLTNFGLDAANSKTISEAFKAFEVPERDSKLASEFVEGDKSVVVPEEAFSNPVSVSRSSKDPGELFDSERRIRNRPDAYRFLSDLVGLEKQIDNNIEALDGLRRVVGENLKLVRGTGLAFLAQSESQLDNPKDAAEVARELRIKIRQNVGAAVSQADNLEAITVASLLLSQSNADK